MKKLIKIWHVIEFLTYYLKRFIKSNIEVAHEIITPKFYMKPAIIEVPIKLKRDHEIFALSNLITMTPGTLSLDISDNKENLYVHAMFVHDADEFIHEMEQLEKRVHKLLN